MSLLLPTGIIHNPRTRKPYQCRLCGRTFTTEAAAKRHLASWHPEAT